jgi:hypothetical protein
MEALPTPPDSENGDNKNTSGFKNRAINTSLSVRNGKLNETDRISIKSGRSIRSKVSEKSGKSHTNSFRIKKGD